MLLIFIWSFIPLGCKIRAVFELIFLSRLSTCIFTCFFGSVLATIPPSCSSFLRTICPPLSLILDLAFCGFSITIASTIQETEAVFLGVCVSFPSTQSSPSHTCCLSFSLAFPLRFYAFEWWLLAPATISSSLWPFHLHLRDCHRSFSSVFPFTWGGFHPFFQLIILTVP